MAGMASSLVRRDPSHVRHTPLESGLSGARSFCCGRIVKTTASVWGQRETAHIRTNINPLWSLVDPRTVVQAALVAGFDPNSVDESGD